MLYLWFKKHIVARKVISGVSLFAFITCFVLSDVWATTKTNDVVRQDSHKETDAVFANLDIDTFTVPEHLGEVKYSFKGDPSKVIIHVQDAHCNHYAQQKISGIINYLVNEYGIRMVNLEGGVGDYDLSVFTSIAGGAVRREVADYFVKNGEINGAEFYAVNNTEKIRLWGVEDKNLYLENLKVYRDSLEYRTEVNEYLKELTHILNNLKRHIYTQELLKLDIAYCAYKIGDMDFRDYLELLIGKAEERGIEVKKFSNLYLLSQAMELENRIEFEKANRERNVLIDELKKRFSRNEARELVEKSVDFRVKKIKRKAFYGYLLSKAENLGLDMTRFSALSDYMVYVSIYESGDRYKVMDELGEFEKEIKEPLFLNDEQRHLDALSQSLALLSNIFAIRLTKRDYRYYLENKSLFEARNFVNFIREEAPKYGIAARPDVNIARLDDFREDIAKFYEYSFRRDDVFLRNLRFSRGEGDIESAILMTGGFHTENLCELFEKQGISYVSILPKFTSEKNYECPYFNLLAGRFIEVERLLSSALAQVGVMAIASSLNPVLCAYVEGARSRVIFELHVRWSVAVKEGRNGIRIRADGKDIAIIDSRGHDLLSTGKEISEEERETFNVANIEEIISSLGIKSVDFRTPAVEVPVAKETVETVLSPKVEDTPEPEGTAVTKWMKELFRKHMRQMPSWMRKLIAAPVLEELLYRGLPLAVTSILIFFITGELDWQNVMLGSILLQSFSGIKFIKDHYAGERSPPEIIKALLAPTVVTLVNAVILPLIVINPLMFIGLSIFTHMVVNLLVLSMPSLELEAARIPAGVKDSVWEKESVTLSDLVDMGVIGSKNVSTHAMRLYEDKATGEKILLKKAPEHSLRSELIGQRIFEKCGLPVPKMRLIIMDGELILMIKYLEGYQESDGNVLPEGFENDQTLQNGILPDLLIYNYDRTPWNMMYLGDKFKFIDFGASITSRAQGGYKGFSPEIVSNGQIEAIWKNNPLYIGTPVNRAYESVLGIENDVKSLLSSMLKVFSLSVDNINEIVDEAYANVNIKDMQANIEHRLNTVLAGNEDPKYFPASVTFQAILEGGEHWTPGNEKEYLKYALITRRKAIIDHFTDMAVKDYTKKITANPVVNWTKYVQNKNEIVKDLQLSDIFKKQVVPVKPLTEDKEQTYPPENGMDVSEAYQLGVTPTDSLMDDDDIIDSVVKKAEELAEEHPEDAGELESVITDIKAAFSLNKINKFKILARIMAAIIGKIRKEDPDRYILHFARDMGLTLIIQNTLAQLESKSPGECGSALYLNRKMMGDVYFDMRNNLGTWSIQKKDLASESEKWFRNKMEAEGETAFKKLSEATYKSLTKMGVLDHQKLLLMDTAFVGTMPWYVYALIRYFDAKEGREKRDIKTLLVKSTSSMKQVGMEDVGEKDLKLFAGHGGITGMLNDNYKMTGLLEGIGDMRQHPVWFDGKKVVEEKARNMLHFHFIGLIFHNMAIAQHLQELGVKVASEWNVPLPELPGILTGLSINNVVGEIGTLKMDLLGSKILEIDENLVEIGSKKADLNFSGIFLKDTKTNIKMFKENKLLDKNIFDKKEKQPEVPAEKKTKLFKGAIPESIMLELVEQGNFVFPKFTKNLKFFFPKIKPWGFTGTLVFWIAVLNALGSWTFGFITSDQMITVIQTAALAGTILAATALLYRKFLAKIKNGVYVDERFAKADRLSQKLRVFTAFRAHSKDRPEVIVVDDMQSLTSEVFTNMLSDRSDIGEEERREAKNIFHLMGRWFDRNDNILYLKVVPRAFFQDILTGKERYVNNALYDTTNNIFIHKNAAKSSELGFGLVIAHERGKRAFFNNKLFVKFRGLIAAEFTGNLYELVFLLGYFARFLRGNIKQNIAIAVGAFLSVQIFVILGVPFFSNLFIPGIVVTLTFAGILLAFFLKCVIHANLFVGSLPPRFLNVINAGGKAVVRELQWRALTRELKEKAEMEKLIMEEPADRPGIIYKIVRIVLLIPVFLFFPSEAFGANGIFVMTGLDVLINILPLWGIVAIGALITGKYIISTPSKMSPVGGALKDIDIGAGDEDAERIRDKVMEESKDKTVVSAEIPPVPVVPEIDLAGVLVDELSGLSRLKEIMPRLEGVELDVLKKMEKMVRGADTLLLRALWIKVVSHFARELFGNIRPGEHASVLLVPFYGTDLDMISQQKLLTEPKFGIQRALRDYAKVHVIYYMADLKGAALKLQIEEKVKEIMNLNGFTEAKGKKDDPLARVIAFVEGDEKNREARDHIERILSGSDLSQNKITGVVSGAFRPEMETERFSLGFLTEFGVGLMERDRVKGEKELLTKIDKALSDMLLSMVSNPEQFEGLAPENIIEGLLNGMFCMRIAKINFQEMRELMEAEKAIRVSL